MSWPNLRQQPVHLTLTGHTGSVVAVCALLGPGGRTLLATAGEDGTVRIWDVATRAVARIIPLGAFVHGIAAVDSSRLVVALEEGIAVIQFAL